MFSTIEIQTNRSNLPLIFPETRLPRGSAAAALLWHHRFMPSYEDQVRRILREAGEPLWASEITERLNAEVGAVAYTVDEIASRLTTIAAVRSLPDGRWELVRGAR
jgi:hypothetical protein